MDSLNLKGKEKERVRAVQLTTDRVECVHPQAFQS